MDTTPNAGMNSLWLIDQIKFLLGVGTLYWAAFKVYNYFKDSLEAIKSSTTDVRTGLGHLKDEVTTQTNTIVNATTAQTKEISELRQDMRFYMFQPVQKAARARRKK